MKSPVRSVRFSLVAGVVCSAGLLVAFAVQGAAAKTDARTAPFASHKCLVMTGSGDPAFVKNFNPFTAVGLPSGAFVRGAFYEPLVITTPAGGGHRYPWLARSWKWSNGNKTLTLSLARASVVGRQAAHVRGRRLHPHGRQAGQGARPDRPLPARDELVSVRAKGRYGVAINLKTPDSQFIAANLNVVFVLPKHIWSKVANPSTYTNSRPVGSGPFTQITRFTSQSYVFGKNPRYWKKGAPKIPCIEYVQASSNDAALLLIQSGQVDWTHNFVPNVESAYERRDRAHYHAFYATTAYPIGLMLDTTKYPYSLKVLRKAISRAIDRKTVSKLGEYGYAPPADAVGLNGLFPQWVTDPAVKSRAKTMADYNPTAAKKLLTDNGFTYRGSQLFDPRGDRVEINPHVISGWSDWVASLQIITANLRAIGIDSARSSSRTGTRGTRTRRARRHPRSSGRSPRWARRTATSSR